MHARIHLSEVIAALSYALDLTDGQPAGHTMRACLIGMRIGRELGLSADERASLYYTLLLKDAGCSSNAAQMCEIFGADDRAVKPHLRFVNLQSKWQTALGVATAVGHGRALSVKVNRFLGIARGAPITEDIIRIRCERGADIVMRLGFPAETADGVRHVDEAWNGGGNPYGRAGADIPLTSRIASLAQSLDIFHYRDGVKAALATARRRSGTTFDPRLVDLVNGWSRDAAWWKRLLHEDLAAEVIAEEPAAHARGVDDAGLDAIARAFADIIDAKSPYTYSHSRNVASYALAIAQTMGLDAGHQRRVYRAGLLHDIGKLGVSNAILDKVGPLTPGEREAVERHPLYTWEILSRVPAFREFAWPAALHHERLDGQGYPWKVSGRRIDIIARILAVADVYEALTADRPYRTGMPWAKTSQILWDGSRHKFDPIVLEALDRCVASATRMEGLEPIAA